MTQQPKTQYTTTYRDPKTGKFVKTPQYMEDLPTSQEASRLADAAWNKQDVREVPMGMEDEPGALAWLLPAAFLLFLAALFSTLHLWGVL